MHMFVAHCLLAALTSASLLYDHRARRDAAAGKWAKAKRLVLQLFAGNEVVSVRSAKLRADTMPALLCVRARATSVTAT